MKRASNFLYAKTNLWICLILTGLMIGYASFIMGGYSECFSVESNMPNALGLSFGYSFETANKFFAIRSEEMILCYKSFILVWDNLFPLLYGAMYIAWISYLFKHETSHSLINLFPIIQIVLDWIENITEINMTNYYLENHTLVVGDVQVASMVSMFKWSASMVCYAIIILGFFKLIKRKYNTRNA